MNMTDNQIVSIIDYWLQHDHEREKRVALGQRIDVSTFHYKLYSNIDVVNLTSITIIRTQLIVYLWTMHSMGKQLQKNGVRAE
jgi:hypothetical protein